MILLVVCSIIYFVCRDGGVANRNILGIRYNKCMPRKWTKKEEDFYRKELFDLYTAQNKTIGEIGEILGIAYQTVFDRMHRLNIPTTPQLKAKYLNRRSDIIIPTSYSDELAEFFGVMLGDGGISHFQITVALGTKEISYAKYVVDLINKLFGAKPKIIFRTKNQKQHTVVYMGSVELREWLEKEGLVRNKVKKQVDVPEWIFSKKSYMERFLRGFFDTDGSVYKLKFGIQIALINKSIPLLQSSHDMLKKLEYTTSKVSGPKLYVTKRADVYKFFHEIKPQNQKRAERFNQFISELQ